MFRIDPYWDSESEFSRLRQEMSALFSGVAGTVHEFPPVNVWAGENDALIRAEIPGLDPSQLDISVTGNSVTLRGNSQPEQCGPGENWYRRERAGGEFTRTLNLPFRIDANQIKATLSKGVLTVSLPRAAEDRPRKIEIKA
jgi:HSP20 family protein